MLPLTQTQLSELPSNQIETEDSLVCDKKQSPKSVLSSERMIEQYRNIGHTLLTAEIASLRIGIPWLPPTERVRSLRAHFKNSRVEDFLRESLVSIPTETLESYCDDLETLPNNEQSSKILSIEGLNLLERYALVAAFVTAVFFTTLVTLLRFSDSFTLACLGAALLGSFAGILGATTCSDSFRRDSFVWAISKETLRRSGGDSGTNTKVRIQSLFDRA